MTSLPPPTGLSRIPPAAVVCPPSFANGRRRNFTQQELDSCWVLFFVDNWAYSRRSGGALAYLHVWLNRRADYFAYSSPPSLASASRRIFAPCEESDSHMVLLSNERCSEHPATAVCSCHGISVQPDTPTFVLALPPSRDVGYSAHAVLS